MNRSILLAALGFVFVSAPAWAWLHGNPVPPPPGGPQPTNPTPPGTPGGGGSPAGPGSGPSTPKAPAAPRPSSGGAQPNGTPAKTGGAGGGAGAQTGSDARWLDPTWDLWWHFHKEEFLQLKRAVHEGLVSTEGLERGGALVPAGAVAYRPSAEQILRDCVPLLSEVLEKERNNELITSALLAAGRLGELGAGEGPRFGPLCARLLREPNQEISEIAALALGVLGASENLALLESLLHDDARGREALGAREVPMRTRSFAAYGLGMLAQQTRSNRTRQMIARALTDELVREGAGATDTRAACIVALALVPLELEREPSASAHWISRQTQLRFLQQLAGDPQTRPLLAAHAATTLAELAADSTPALELAAADLLTALLRRDATEASVRESCLIGLGRLCDDDQDPGDKRTRLELRRTLSAGSTPERAFALMALSEGAARPGDGLEPGGALGEVREALLEELAHGKSRTRAWAALALGVLEFRLQGRGAEASAAVHEGLRRALANAASPDESAACAMALGLARDGEGALVLGERLAGAGDDVLRGYFALAIGLSGNRALADGVRTVSAGARYRPFLLQQCAVALALLGDKNLAPGLAAELRTANGQSSQSLLAQALGRVGDSRTVPVLVGMIRDRGLTDTARGSLASALGIVCDKDELPWYHALSSRVNWRAATSTLIAGNGTGVLEIL